MLAKYYPEVLMLPTISLIVLSMLGCQNSISNDKDLNDTSPVDTADSDTEDVNNIEPTIENLQQAGAYRYESESLTRPVASCDSDLSYTHVQTTKESASTILLAHGFARSSANMLDWAHHWASWGFNVLVIDMCHFSDHEKNGNAIAELAVDLGIDAPIFAGQSAGGLASFVAGANTSNALGVLGLDATDNMDTLGASIAAQVSIPVLGLVGESSSCNAENNGITMLQGASNSTLLRVLEADHCDFEFPTDDLCTLLCQNNDATISDEAIHSTILALSTAGLLWLEDNSSEAWDLWTGEQKQALIEAGAIADIN